MDPVRSAHNSAMTDNEACTGGMIAYPRFYSIVFNKLNDDTINDIGYARPGCFLNLSFSKLVGAVLCAV